MDEEKWKETTIEEKIEHVVGCIQTMVDNDCFLENFFKGLNELIEECRDEYDNMIPIEKLEELIKEL